MTRGFHITKFTTRGVHDKLCRTFVSYQVIRVPCLSWELRVPRCVYKEGGEKKQLNMERTIHYG